MHILGRYILASTLLGCATALLCKGMDVHSDGAAILFIGAALLYALAIGATAKARLAEFDHKP